MVWFPFEYGRCDLVTDVTEGGCINFLDWRYEWCFGGGKQCWTVDDTDMVVEKMLIIKSPMGSWRAIQALLGFCTLASSLFSNVLPCCSSPCLVRNRENVFLVIDDKGKTVALSLSTLETTNLLCLHRQGQASWQNDRRLQLGSCSLIMMNSRALVVSLSNYIQGVLSS